MKVVDRLLVKAGTRGAQRLLGWATLVGLGATTVLGLFVVPADAEQGDVQRLMYVHVPAAWLAFLSFGVVFVASVAYLRTGRIRWDRVAVASAEIGVLFCVLTLALGSLWGRPVWGTWWTWDPRLTSTLLISMIFFAYLVLRSFGSLGEVEKRFAAALAIIGILDIPVIKFSVERWRGTHPTVVTGKGGGIHRDMVPALVLSLLLFLVLSIVLIWTRARVERLRQSVQALELDAVERGLLEEC